MLPILLVILFISSAVLFFDIRRRNAGKSGVIEHVLTDVVPIIQPITPHCHDPQLKVLMNAFKSHHFDAVEKLLLGFSEDYRSFGFRMLSEIGNKDSMQIWLEQSNSLIPRILLGLHIANEAWSVRGGGFIDTVSDTQYMNFLQLLQQAEETLTETPTNNNSPFEINRLIALINVYKGLSQSESLLETFQKGLMVASNNIELHVEYFEAITSKWGGSNETMTHYLDHIMPKEPELLADCVLALYYRDSWHIDEVCNSQIIQEIKFFVKRIETQDKKIDNLHRFTLYDYMLPIVRIDSPILVEKYIQLVEECYA